MWRATPLAQWRSAPPQRRRSGRGGAGLWSWGPSEGVTRQHSSRRQSATQIGAAARLLGSTVIFEPDPLQALRWAAGLRRADKVVVVTGSHLLAGTVLGTASHHARGSASTASASIRTVRAVRS